MSDYETTGPQDHKMNDDGSALCGQPPSSGYSLPGWSVVGSPLSSRESAFTLAELLVSVGVLGLLAFLATQLLNTAVTVTSLGHKQMDGDSQARDLLDRMALDVTQMVKRSDICYHLKASASASDCPSTECGTQPGNDEMAFYSNVPAYYASDSTGSQRSPVSLVGYRINSSATSFGNKMERLGAGLVWNGASPSNPPNLPAIFWTCLNPWASGTATTSTLQIVGSQVFRFEYHYLLKNGNSSATPWYTASRVSGMRDVAALIVDIAVLDPKGRLLLDNSARVPPPNDNITVLAGSLSDYNGEGAGALLTNWRNVLNANMNLPRRAISGIRLYERYLYLSPPILGTP